MGDVFTKIRFEEPLKLYALLIFPHRSVVNVAPKLVPLFPLPDASFGLPEKGQ